MAANQRIEDYALISNCATAALVGRNGSIDWLCLPRFDSAACFAALLGESEHGRWLIAPADPSHRVERRYLNGSLILVTMFETAGGAVEVVELVCGAHAALTAISVVVSPSVNRAVMASNACVIAPDSRRCRGR